MKKRCQSGECGFEPSVLLWLTKLTWGCVTCAGCCGWLICVSHKNRGYNIVLLWMVCMYRFIHQRRPTKMNILWPLRITTSFLKTSPVTGRPACIAYKYRICVFYISPWWSSFKVNIVSRIQYPTEVDVIFMSDLPPRVYIRPTHPPVNGKIKIYLLRKTNTWLHKKKWNFSHSL